MYIFGQNFQVLANVVVFSIPLLVKVSNIYLQYLMQTHFCSKSFLLGKKSEVTQKFYITFELEV